MKWFRNKRQIDAKSATPDVAATPVPPQPQCPHLRWEIRRLNPMAYATCLDCHENVELYILFNALHDRMEAALERLQQETKR